uniref:Secreted protein n=1 Tax=Ascaris lumbricoides TaxID=6252 RepID=A0A0M3HFS9_ASCLU
MLSSSIFCTSTKSAICCNSRRPILKCERRDESTIIPSQSDSQSTRIIAFVRCEETLIRPTLKTVNRRIVANKYFNCYSVIMFAILLETAQAAGKLIL